MLGGSESFPNIIGQVKLFIMKLRFCMISYVWKRTIDIQVVCHPRLYYRPPLDMIYSNLWRIDFSTTAYIYTKPYRQPPYTTTQSRALLVGIGDWFLAYNFGILLCLCISRSMDRDIQGLSLWVKLVLVIWEICDSTVRMLSIVYRIQCNSWMYYVRTFQQ